MKKTKRVLSLLISLVMVLSVLTPTYTVSAASSPKIKNIIVMIPDGGGMASFYLADEVKQAGGFSDTKYPNRTKVEKGEMYLKQYLVGAETTYSDSDAITDSAASGTAIACGYKTTNGYVGVDSSAVPHANILEACQDLGKNTGLVVSTVDIAHATPAAFSGHDISRNEYTPLAKQIVNQNLDVTFSNANAEYSSMEWFSNAELEEQGYKVITNTEQFNNIKPGDKVWGKLPVGYDLNIAESTPNLSELTAAAIKALNDDNENGFFLMVEGSSIDGGGHNNDAVLMTSEWLAFDEAFKVAVEFAKGRNDTVVVALPDHDTGGMYYDYNDLDEIVAEVQNGTNSSKVKWELTSHTARNGGVFMYIPEGLSYPTGIDPTKFDQVNDEFYIAYGDYSEAYPENAVNVIDNTDVPKYLASLIGVDLNEMTEKLFVDVTDLGTYSDATEMFTFTDKDISIEANTSTAYVNGLPVSLDGEVAVYINNKFYVPKRVFTLEDTVDLSNGIVVTADYNTGELTYSGNINIPETNVSTLITKPDTELDSTTFDGVNSGVAYFGQTKTDVNGIYTFKAKVPRLEGEYTIYTNYTDSEDDVMSRGYVLKNTIPTLSVMLGDDKVSDISQLKAGDEIDVMLSGFDLENDFEGALIVAQYMGNELKGMDYIPVTGGSVNYGDEIEESATIVEGINTVKVFYWNKSTLVPLIGQYIID